MFNEKELSPSLSFVTPYHWLLEQHTREDTFNCALFGIYTLRNRAVLPHFTLLSLRISTDLRSSSTVVSRQYSLCVMTQLTRDDKCLIKDLRDNTAFHF